jgi:hypothetical protein
MAATRPLTYLEWFVTSGLLACGAVLIMLGIQLNRNAKKESRVGSLHLDFRENKTRREFR